MNNRIFIQEDKEYSLSEMAHFVSRALTAAASLDTADCDEVRIPRDDVFFTIRDVLGFLNQFVPGEFRFDQSTFQSYHVHYRPSGVTKQQQKKGVLINLAQTAIYLKKETGQYPVWAQKNDAMMELIKSIESKRSAASTAVVTEEILDNRAHIAVQLYEREGKLPEWVNDDPRLKEKVDLLISENTDHLQSMRELLKEDADVQ